MLENLTRNEGKPEAAVPKIVEGRLSGFYKDNVLIEQGFVRDPKTTVGSLETSRVRLGFSGPIFPRACGAATPGGRANTSR